MIADVNTSELLDRLLIVPRNQCDKHEVVGRLRMLLPGVDFRLSAVGIVVPAAQAPSLLDLPSHPDLELRWNSEGRLFAENRQSALRHQRYLHDAISMIVAGGRLAAESYLADIHDLSVLDDHQYVNVAAMTLPGSYGMCIFDEQGAGKTVTLIFAFDVLVARDEADFALIVAPKSMIAEWPHDIRRFKGDLYSVAVATGNRTQKLAAIASRRCILVTNFETAVTMEGDLLALLRLHRRRAIMVVDESFIIKNLNAKRTRALRRLREWCGRAFVLCGTPAPNAPQDLVQQFNIVDFGTTFRDVVVPEDREAARPVVQATIEERGLYVRHLKKDVLPNLPAKRFQRIMLPLEPVQARLYTRALHELVTDLEAATEEAFRKEIVSFLAKRTALLQICSNPASVATGYLEVPAKLRALDQLLEHIVEVEREKAVLWSFYTASLDAIVARYQRYEPVRYDGTVTDVAERRESVRKFQEDDKTMLFIGNPAAAGAGLTLHRARYGIYESMSNQAAHYLQSLDRIHRRGQERDVEYLVLLCEGTIEVDEYERLVSKEASAQQLLGDDVEPPVTRESMLREVLQALRTLAA